MTDQTITTGAMLITLAIPNTDNPNALAEYTEKAPQLGIARGMQPIKQFKVVDQIFGEHQTAIVSVVLFPSVEAITDMFEADEYQLLIALREEAFKSISYYISAPDQSLTLDDTAGKTYLLVKAQPGDPASLKEYQQNLGSMAAGYGAQPITTIPLASMYLGDHPAAFLNITEFPDADAVRNFFGADEYQPFLPLREKALVNLNLYIAQ